MLTQAIKGIKANPQSKSTQESSKAKDIFMRIKKPNELVIKDKVGGRETRQIEREPYSRDKVENLKKLLGGRFVPKGEMKKMWEEDLTNKNDTIKKESTIKFRVFIRGLPKGCTNNILKSIFEKYGEVTGINIGGQSADVYFNSREAAQKAVDNQTVIKGQEVKLMICDSKIKSTEEKSRDECKSLESNKLTGPESILSRIKKVKKS